MEDEHHLDQEIHNTVRKIIRDFVSSWYSTVSSESGFETEVQEAMISMAMELKIRARQVHRKVLWLKTSILRALQSVAVCLPTLGVIVLHFLQ